MKNPFYDEILNGMFEHQHDLSASQKIVRQTPPIESFSGPRPRSGKLAEPMTLIEWRIMLVFEHSVQNLIVKGFLHWVLREFVEISRLPNGVVLTCP